MKLVKGRAPQNKNEIAVESNTLEKSGLGVGDQTKLVVAGSAVPVTIVGEQQFAGGQAGQTIVSVYAPAAQEWFAPDGMVQSISVRADDGVSQQALRDRIAATLPRASRPSRAQPSPKRRRRCSPRGWGS